MSPVCAVEGNPLPMHPIVVNAPLVPCGHIGDVLGVRPESTMDASVVTLLHVSPVLVTLHTADPTASCTLLDAIRVSAPGPSAQPAPTPMQPWPPVNSIMSKAASSSCRL